MAIPSIDCGICVFACLFSWLIISSHGVRVQGARLFRRHRVAYGSLHDGATGCRGRSFQGQQLGSTRTQCLNRAAFDHTRSHLYTTTHECKQSVRVLSFYDNEIWGCGASSLGEALLRGGFRDTLEGLYIRKNWVRWGT